VAKKKQAKTQKVIYADGENPPVEFADFVRLSLGPHGILFGFGQNHPFRKQISLTYEVLLPHDVAGRLHHILGDQLKEYEKKVTESLKMVKEES